LSDDVVDTLFNLFGTEGSNAQVRCDALRQEPRFYFRAVKSKKEQDEKTLEAIKLLPKPLVVYVLEPREAKDLQRKLRQAGFLNIPTFTGETNESERNEVLTGWKKHDYDVVIATSAFGIGVDKPDVRTIIHACCPENLSRFYQEVGRGGRDQLPSISLFMPYQSSTDKDSDVHRALGLSNKRVLTVERAVARWKGLLNHPAAIIDVDECVLDTSATPTTMTEEEVEYAGNRNVAWNINLLLFLHRTGFIKLMDARYVINNSTTPAKKYYTVTIKLLQPDILGDFERLSKAIEEPRNQESHSQMTGYYFIRNLVSSPKSKCWGQVFKHLFPLSREVCNGCPSDPEGRTTTDALYKLRIDPNIKLPSSTANRHLERNMGSFDQMVVRRPHAGPCTLDEATLVTEKANQNDIGVLVVPDRFLDCLNSTGLLMSYDEFYFAAVHCPYLFAKGVLCIFDNQSDTDVTLYKNLERFNSLHYRRILYCNDNAIVTSNGKSIRDCVDGYAISIEKM
jgi:hypothetical protein